MRRHQSLQLASPGLTIIAVGSVELARLIGSPLPIPFMIIYGSVTIVASVAGMRVGLISAAIAGAYVVYSTVIGYGPQSLTGGPFQASVGVLIGLLIAVLIGRFSDSNQRLIDALDASKEELADYGAQLEIEVERQTKQLSDLIRKLLRLQEEERANLSRELHDGISQSLAGAKLHLTAMNPPDQNVMRMRDATLNLIDASMQEIREIALTLRPQVLDQLGLQAAIRSFVENQTASSNLTVELNLSDNLPADLPESAEILAFRCIQEAVSNVVKHAKAGSLKIGIRHTEGWIHISVEDDGRGFDAGNRLDLTEEGGLGIPGMIERFNLLGGYVDIDSAPGRGTRLNAHVNLSVTRNVQHTHPPVA